jgi:hypothetical protein
MKKTKVIPFDRALHAVDVANEIKSGFFGVNDVVQLHRAWDLAVQPSDKDQYFLATGPGTAEALAFGWKDARPVVRSGADGADDAIIEYLDVEYVSSRFTKVFLGTGDHKMLDVATQLIERGVSVTIVARRGTLHQGFKSIGAEIIYLDEAWALAA